MKRYGTAKEEKKLEPNFLTELRAHRMTFCNVLLLYMYEAAALVDGSFAFLPRRAAFFFFNFCFSPSRLRCPQALQRIKCDCRLSTAKLGAVLYYTILHAVLLLQLFLH